MNHGGHGGHGETPTRIEIEVAINSPKRHGALVIAQLLSGADLWTGNAQAVIPLVSESVGDRWTAREPQAFDSHPEHLRKQGKVTLGLRSADTFRPVKEGEVFRAVDEP